MDQNISRKRIERDKEAARKRALELQREVEDFTRQEAIEDSRPKSDFQHPLTTASTKTDATSTSTTGTPLTNVRSRKPYQLHNAHTFLSKSKIESRSKYVLQTISINNPKLEHNYEPTSILNASKTPYAAEWMESLKSTLR